MTTAYSLKDGTRLAYIKQVATLAVIENVVTWKELDDFEEDVLKNVKGIEGLQPSTLEFMHKVEDFITQYPKAC